MEVLFGVAKIKKWAVAQSGDTLEMVERPHGGISMVLVDGQRSGRSAKKISNVVARKAIQLLAEGVRDGPAARAANDYLYAYRDGKVSATLNIISLDTNSETIVVSRNNESPVLVYTPQLGLYQLDEPSRPIGTWLNNKPCITEIPMEIGPLIVAFTDGLRHAGRRQDNRMDPLAATRALLNAGISDPQQIADRLVQEAIERDDGHPRDDISVVVVKVAAKNGDDVRRLNGRLPLG
jgi:serine phosphatase RsbU (regulator of sigma subunit)